MNHLIFCIGISGSGKSTWTEKFINENSNYIRVNRDSLRKMFSVGYNNNHYYNNKNFIESMLLNDIQSYTITSLCDYNKNIIIDNTNLRIKDIDSIINLVRNHCIVQDREFYNISFKLFDINLDAAKFRVLNREQLSNSKDVDYIDKQSILYKNTKEYILKKYSNNIL